MAYFSLIETLESLAFDPLPNAKYRRIIRHLKNLRTIIENANNVKLFCVDDLLPQLTSLPDEIKENKNHFVPSIAVYKLLCQMQVPLDLDFIVAKLLRFTVIKLSKSNSEDADGIMLDFLELQQCISVFRSGTWNTANIDGTILIFTGKLAKMLREFSADTFKKKFELFGIMRMMLLHLGRYPNLGAGVMQQITNEVKFYYREIPSVKSDKSDYLFQTYLTYLFILNDIMNFMNNINNAAVVLTELRHILNGPSSQSTCNRELYLVQSILRAIEVYLTEY